MNLCFSISSTCSLTDFGYRFSTLGQGLKTTIYTGESLFAIALATFGLILMAMLIGNIQVPSSSN
jgi:hypothetical protein